MQVWFGCTTLEWDKHRENYFLLRDYLKELGCVIPFDWIDEADSNMRRVKSRPRNINQIFQYVVGAIDDADAVIIEYTVPNFSSSYEINYALWKRKPTLVMRLHKDNPKFTNSFLDALQSPFLTLREYTKKNYQEIVNEFIGLNRIEQGQQRYNIVLDKKQKYYLDWAATTYKRSRSQMIRTLVDREIDSDKQYQKYINPQRKAR